MLFLGFTPVFAAIANGESNFFHLSVLFLIGILVHIFGFVQNDVYDIEIDKRSKYVKNRPLVTGAISMKNAELIVIVSFSISIILAVSFLFTLFSFIVLLFSFVCMTIYNKYSKEFYGMEYALSLGVFCCGIFGALTVSRNVSILSMIVSFTAFMQWLFSVGISANLKDVEYDSKLGIRTTPMAFGVKVSTKKFLMPTYFKFYAVSIKSIHIFVISLPFFLGYTSIFVYNIPFPGLFFLIITVILLVMTSGILSSSPQERKKMLRFEGLQEGLALLLIPIALMSYLFEKISPIVTILLVFLLIIWPLFWLRGLFGKKMIPLE